jgi:3-oxoadipate CoA-transferase alpha subunit
MLNKRIDDSLAALSGLSDGATVLVSGFGDAGTPTTLLAAVLAHGARDLTLVNNNAGAGSPIVGALIEQGRVRKVICSFPRGVHSRKLDERFARGEIAIEVVPQGTLAERLRAGGAGIPAFYTPTGVGTRLGNGKEHRIFNGQEFILEEAICADFALVRACTADRWGNLTYRKAARNFGPVMCTAAEVTVAEVDRILPLGSLDPEVITTPGIHVDRVVLASATAEAEAES